MIRQVVKTLIRADLLLRPIQMSYATETKNVFTLPKRQFIHPSAQGHLTTAIAQAYTVRMLAYLFRDNIKFFTDLHVGAMYQHIVRQKLEIDDTMNSVIIPITIEYINSFTIQNGNVLGQIAYCVASLKLEHQGLWQAIFKKLDQENIYRYLTLDQTVNLLHSLVLNSKFSNHSLITKLSNVVSQQKAYYDHKPFLLTLIREVNDNLSQKGEKTLKITQAYQQIA